jgi:hypothetical protein
MPTPATRLTCACGQLHLEVTGAPIVRAECHCNSCREAGARMRALPAAPTFQEADGSTRFVLYRKDRVRFLQGAERLAAFRLKPESPTRRAVATCCNTPVFLEFKGGHWLSFYPCLWPAGSLPPPQLRTMTSDLPKGTALSGDVPSGTLHTLGFFAKLFGAWAAMGFRAPKVEVGRTELRV